MPTYEYPAVYVTEVESGVTPIEGVPTSTATFLGPDCFARLQARLANMPPNWTEANRSDPGIAVLELCAWIAETLATRSGPIPARAARSLSRVAAASLQSLHGRRLPKGSALKKIDAYAAKVAANHEGRNHRPKRQKVGSALAKNR